MEPRADLSHAANLLWMMEGKEPPADRVHYLASYLVLLADHGLNASTFAARDIASTGSDLTSCVVEQHQYLQRASSSTLSKQYPDSGSGN